MLLKLPGIKSFSDSLPKDWWSYVILFWFCAALVNTTFLRIVVPYEEGPLKYFEWIDIFLFVLPGWILWTIVSLAFPFLYGRLIKTRFTFILFTVAILLMTSMWSGFYRVIYLNNELELIAIWRQFTHSLGKNIIQDFCLFLMTYIAFIAWSSKSKIHSLSETIHTLEKINAEIVNSDSSKDNRPSDQHKISLRVNGKIQFVELSAIDHLRASGSYVEICTPIKRFVVVGNLKSFEEKLSPQGFFRIHRSTIVRKEAIETLKSLPNGEYEIITKMGAKLRLSRSFRDKAVYLK